MQLAECVANGLPLEKCKQNQGLSKKRSLGPGLGSLPALVKSGEVSRQSVNPSEELSLAHQRLERMQDFMFGLISSQQSPCEVWLNAASAAVSDPPTSYRQWIHGLSESGVDIALAHHVAGERDGRVGNKGGVFIDVGDSSCSREQPPPTLLLEKCLGWRGVCVEPFPV